MKKIALVTAMALAATAGAHAEVTVYGKAFLGLDYVSNDGSITEEDAVQLVSNASRIGLKGSEQITDDIEAFYKAEYEAYFDSGSKSGDEFSARNIYAGLKHKELGSLLFGRNDTLLKDVGADADLFNDLNAGNLDDKRTFAGEERASNLIQYSAPSSLPVNAAFGVSLDGATESEVDGADGEVGIHGLLGYEYEGLGLNVAYAGNFEAEFNGAGALIDALDIDASDALIADVLRFVATYEYAGVELSGLYQFANPDDDSVIDSENAFLISGMYPIADTKYSVGAQYQYSTTEFNVAGLDDVDIAQYGVIGEYKFTKAAKALAYLANRNTDLGNGIEDQDRLVAGTAFELKF